MLHNFFLSLFCRMQTFSTPIRALLFECICTFSILLFLPHGLIQICLSFFFGLLLLNKLDLSLSPLNNIFKRINLTNLILIYVLDDHRFKFLCVRQFWIGKSSTREQLLLQQGSLLINMFLLLFRSIYLFLKSVFQ